MMERYPTMKTALIMEGGAMRGMFTCGVMDVLMERGVSFDAAAGISAGAVFGCNFKSGQIGRPIRYNKRFCADPRYQSLRSLLRTGDLYGADFCYRELPDELDVFDRKAFRENPMAFYVGAFDVETGEMAYHRCMDGEKEDIQWMRASASMPLVSRPVRIEGRLLLDGGILEPTPYRFMEGLGYRKNLVILTQPREYRKQKTKGLPLIRALLRKYPKAAEALAARHESYNRHIAYIREKEQKGEALVICPEGPLHIRRTERDPRALERVYQLGRREAENRLPRIMAFLRGADPARGEKEALRQAVKKRLEALPEAYLQEAGEKIWRAAAQTEAYRRAESVFLYVSVDREPDTRKLLREALAAGKMVYVPRCWPEGRMEAVRIRDERELTPGILGIPEPLSGRETAEPGEIGLAVVPCVAASLSGRRLGHGAGYYDRFLRGKRPVTLCLCYQKLLTEEIPMTSLDVWMDWVVTENGAARRTDSAKA